MRTSKKFCEKANLFLVMFAAIVKLFPTWAMRFTKRSNPNAYLFLLPLEKDIEMIEKGYNIKERIWSKEARVFAFKNQAHPNWFAEILRTSEEFDALLANGHAEVMERKEAINAVISQKQYTLSEAQAIKVCIVFERIKYGNEAVKNLFLFQSQKLTPKLLNGLTWIQIHALADEIIKNGNVSKTLSSETISYLIQKCGNVRPLDELQLQQKSIKPERLDTFGNKVAKIVRMLINEKYIFTHQDIPALDENLLESWICSVAPIKAFGPLQTAWLAKRELDKAMKSLWLRAKISQDCVLLRRFFSCYWHYCNEGYMEAISYMLKDISVACPEEFYYLRMSDADELYRLNFELCLKAGVLGDVSFPEAKFFSEENYAAYLIERAKAEKLSQQEFKTVTDFALKEKIRAILAEKAQVAWVKDAARLLVKNSSMPQIIEQQNEYKKILKETKLCSESQLTLFSAGILVLYSAYHRCNEDVFQTLIKESGNDVFWEEYIKKQKITLKEYDMLLTSPYKHLAVIAKNYILQ